MVVVLGVTLGMITIPMFTVVMVVGVVLPHPFWYVPVSGAVACLAPALWTIPQWNSLRGLTSWQMWAFWVLSAGSWVYLLANLDDALTDPGAVAVVLCLATGPAVAGMATYLRVIDGETNRPAVAVVVGALGAGWFFAGAFPMVGEFTW